MLFHVLGVLLFPLCGWFAGDAFRQKTDMHLQALRMTLELFQQIRQEIAFRRADLQQLCRQLQREGVLPQMESSYLLQEFPPPEELLPAEKACFAECISGLGKTEAQQECERLDYYIARFQDYRHQAQQTAQKQAGLPQKLGFAAGAVVALMLV